jgi:hypothetical protein
MKENLCINSPQDGSSFIIDFPTATFYKGLNCNPTKVDETIQLSQTCVESAGGGSYGYGASANAHPDDSSISTQYYGGGNYQDPGSSELFNLWIEVEANPHSVVPTIRTTRSPSRSPTMQPSEEPTTSQPTNSPSTAPPTGSLPLVPYPAPTFRPSKMPSKTPSAKPSTSVPSTNYPTSTETFILTNEPTQRRQSSLPTVNMAISHAPTSHEIVSITLAQVIE